MVLVVSTITALATNFPQITVKAFILEHFGQQAFAVNGTLESVRALCAFVSQPLIGVLSDRYGRRLPLAACVEKKVFVTHGGLSSDDGVTWTRL